MFYNHKIAVVIPTFRAEKWIAGVIRSIPYYVDYILVVDDKSPDRSADEASAVGDPRVLLLRHKKNRGVGGAMVTGFGKALELEADIIVKMDSDGQMNPDYLCALLYPLAMKECDYAKGNRFSFIHQNHTMPLLRKIGSQALTFLTKMASGYWHIFDPQNGYLAIRTDVLRRIRLEWIDPSYFFENSMLLNLNIIEARTADVSIPSRYGDEESSMSLFWVLRKFPGKLLRGYFHRIFYRYVYRDISPVSIMLALGSLLMTTGLVIGLVAWYKSLFYSQPIVLGTLALGLVPIIMGFQLLLNGLILDVQQTPAGLQKVYDFTKKDLARIHAGNISL